MRRSSDVNFLNALLDHANDKISFVSKDYVYLAVNQRYVDSYNKPLNEILGKKVWEILGKKNFDNIKPYIDRALLGEETIYEGWFNFYDGRYFLKVFYKPYFEKEIITGIVVTVHDNTEVKLLQIENENQYKLLLEKSKTAKLGNMLAFITHQMRQPLNTIATSLMKMDTLLQEKDYDDLHQLIDINENVVSHLSKTLDSISEFHSTNGNMENIKLNYIIDTSLLVVEHLITTNDIKVNIICDEDIVVKSIKSELIHIMLILINNAYESILSLKKNRIITIEVLQTSANVCIKVFDNGKGVESKILPFLFEAGTTSKSDIGHGYGLYFAKKILQESLNGTIKYISKEEGHYFQVCLNIKN